MNKTIFPDFFTKEFIKECTRKPQDRKAYDFVKQGNLYKLIEMVMPLGACEKISRRIPYIFVEEGEYFNASDHAKACDDKAYPFVAVLQNADQKNDPLDIGIGFGLYPLLKNSQNGKLLQHQDANVLPVVFNLRDGKPVMPLTWQEMPRFVMGCTIPGKEFMENYYPHLPMDLKMCKKWFAEITERFITFNAQNEKVRA